MSSLSWGSTLFLEGVVKLNSIWTVDFLNQVHSLPGWLRRRNYLCFSSWCKQICGLLELQLLPQKLQGLILSYGNMDKAGGHCAKWNFPGAGRQSCTSPPCMESQRWRLEYTVEQRLSGDRSGTMQAKAQTGKYMGWLSRELMAKIKATAGILCYLRRLAGTG